MGIAARIGFQVGLADQGEKVEVTRFGLNQQDDLVELVGAVSVTVAVMGLKRITFRPGREIGEKLAPDDGLDAVAGAGLGEFQSAEKVRRIRHGDRRHGKVAAGLYQVLDLDRAFEKRKRRMNPEVNEIRVCHGLSIHDSSVGVITQSPFIHKNLSCGA